MNKERAREELTLMRDNFKMDLEETQTTHWTDNKTTYDKRVELITDSIQALDIAIDSLDNEWVDVRDRLPSESGVYLVTVDYSPPSIQVYEVSYGYSRELEKECFYDYDEGWGEREVAEIIAWKPLPKPYKRSEQNE